MKKTIQLIGTFTLIALIGFSVAACGGGGKTITSADALKAYLDSQPANGPDKPIKVAMKINENMVADVREAINSAGKYVSLNLTGSPLTTIPRYAFHIRFIGGCTGLTGITIPVSVTSIGESAFSQCTDLTSVIFQGTIASSDFPPYAFDGDLRDKYLAEGGGIGTYTRDRDGKVWTKKGGNAGGSSSNSSSSGDELAGTTWEGSKGGGAMTLTFNSPDVADIDIRGQVGASATYTLSGNTVNITYYDDPCATGTLSGNTLLFPKGIDLPGYTYFYDGITLTKQ